MADIGARSKGELKRTFPKCSGVRLFESESILLCKSFEKGVKGSLIRFCIEEETSKKPRAASIYSVFSKGFGSCYISPSF
ncbi:MAG: hypothetical protein ACJAT2_000596 [Bacteriovoracaceae bacterium]|jgi:hypothetical protein